jgi:hypothetical protein
VENSRKLGCGNEFSMTYELSCGKLPNRRPGDFLARFHDNPNCSGEPEIHIGSPAKCISGFFPRNLKFLGDGFSGKFECDAHQGFIFEQFSVSQCAGRRDNVYQYPSGCNRFIGSSSFFLEKCVKQNNSTLIK